MVVPERETKQKLYSHVFWAEYYQNQEQIVAFE